MNNELYEKTLHKLTIDTQNGNIQWISLFDLTEAEDLENVLPQYKYVFWNNEWHTTNFTNTFIAFLEPLIVVVTEEEFEDATGMYTSSNETSQYTEYNLYISKNKNAKPHQLPIPNTKVQPLLQLIKKNYYPSNAISEMLNEFLEN